MKNSTNTTKESLNRAFILGKSMLLLLFLCISFAAAGQTINICSNQPIPSGYVIVSTQSSASCQSPWVQHTIQNISGMASGTTLDVCSSSTLPEGWVILYYWNCPSCCGAFQKINIKNINGMAPGTSLTVCSSSDIPAGWVITNSSTTGTCGIFQLLTIKNINCLPIGTTQTVCSSSNIPEGWLITSTVSCTCCAPFALMTIAKISGFETPSVTASNGIGCTGTPISLVGTPAGGVFSVPNPYSGPTISSYTYTYTNAGGCSASASAYISVNPLPTVTAFDVSGCVGTPIPLFGSPDGGTWSVANPYTGASTTYTHFFTDVNGCSNTSAPANISVHPVAPETCNGVDDNCNGQFDEGNVCGENNNLDGDSYTIAQGDCNDFNAAIHPGAAELCNGIDDNCDGKTDQLSVVTQEWEWAKNATGTYSQFAYDVATDPSGNVFVTGRFYSTITFGNFTLTATGSDIYLVKYNASGDVLWAKSFDGDLYELTSLATDQSGNVYMTGGFQSPSIVFGSITLNNATGFWQDLFVVKLNSDGIVQWAHNTASGGALGNDIATDASGNVYVAGWFISSSVTFGTETLTNSQFGGQDIFLTKYDADGNVLWAKNAVCTSSSDVANTVTTDAEGSIYITGRFGDFQGTSTIQFGTLTPLTSSGNNDVFVAKYDPSGNAIWAKMAGGINSESGVAMAIDQSGNVYVTGDFASPTISFGSYSLSNTNSNGQSDIFLTKYNVSGMVQWAKNIDGTAQARVYAVSTDPAGNVYMEGSFSSDSITFGSVTLYRTGTWAGYYYDLFIAKYDPAGIAQWATNVAGSGGYSGDGIGNVATDAIGNVYIASMFSDATLILDSVTLTNTVYGVGNSLNMFIAKYSAIDTISINLVNSSYCPGESGSVNYMAGGTFNSNNTFTAQLSDANGSFAAPVEIGSINATSTCGGISVTIPLSTPAGTGYRIRVVSSNAAVTGSDNGSNITIGTVSTYYADADNDSHGDLNATIQGCSPPNGYIDDTTDCDDTNANVHPGELELCNSIDDDCDNQIDEEGPFTFYADTDGDGFGNPDISALLCNASFGFVSNNGDCDDNNASVNPAASPIKQWDLRYGGNGTDRLAYTQQTADGGYILGGRSKSPVSGDKSQPNWDTNNATHDFWVVKTDASGVKQWDKRYGGTDDDGLIALQQTSDGGYILGGYSYSGVSGDKTQTSRGLEDYWVVKIDANGNKVWDAAFGGSDYDELQALQQTSDGGYIFGGYSVSGISGDRTQASQGGQDYWIVKTDANGIKQWDKRFGGISTDGLYSLKQSSDGGYILGGRSFSGISGDKTQASQGLYDYWIIKIDAAGSKVWDKGLGGSGDDYFYSLKQTIDGSYLLGGYSNSGVGGDKTQASQGSNDYWVVKINADGTKQWDARYGGTGDDQSYTLQLTNDGGYLLGGRSKSGIGGEKTQASQGLDDYWIVKADINGVKQWDKGYGGAKNDVITGMQQTSDGGFVMAGYSFSDISSDKTQPNWDASLATNDYWVIKLAVSNGLQQFYADADGDSYGSASDYIFACSQPLGFAPLSGDCNDANASMHPGVADMCNGIDDNCSGVVDENAISATITPAGSVTTCSGVDIILTANIGTGINYQWLKNTAAVSGASSSTYATSKAGNYQVTESNSFGCTSTSTATIVSVKSSPSATITPLGNLDICATGSVVLQANGGTGLTYQWIKGSNNIAGATNQTYTATQAKTYKVIVTNSNGCSKTSSGTKVTKSCKEAEGQVEEAEKIIASKFAVYPNPTNGRFMIDLIIESEENEMATIEIIDALGQIIHSEKVTVENSLLKKEMTLDHSLVAGMYWVRVLVNNKMYSSQIVYQK